MSNELFLALVLGGLFALAGIVGLRSALRAPKKRLQYEAPPREGSKQIPLPLPGASTSATPADRSAVQTWTAPPSEATVSRS